MKGIKASFYKLLIKVTRYYYLMKSTKFLGKCYTILEDKIVVELSNFKLRLSTFEGIFYHLNLEFISLPDDIKKECGLDKPIEYVIENMSFKDDVYIESSKLGDQRIIFRDCEFYEDIDIPFTHKIMFEDCDCYKGFLINISAIDVEIVNSNIGDGNVSIEASNCLKVIDSNIIADVVTLESNKIIAEGKNSFVGNEFIYIEDKNQNEIKNLKAPIIYYNGANLAHDNQKIDINQEKISLINARKEVTECLKKYSYQYNEYYEKEVLTKYTVENIHKLLQKKK